MTAPLRGHIAARAVPPAIGEDIEGLVELNGVAIEDILSGAVTGPIEYLQDHVEWVLVMSGGAVLEVDDTTVAMGVGDWVVLPAGVPHRLLSVESGTRWLAVRIPAVPPP